MINYFIKINEYYFFTLHFFYICIEYIFLYRIYRIYIYFLLILLITTYFVHQNQYV